MAAKTDRIEIRHLERTCLDEIGLKAVIEKFTKLEHRIVVSFDKKLTLYEGNYELDTANRHYIKLAVSFFTGLDSKAQEFQYISNLLHELCHAHQQEFLKEKFHSKEFAAAKDVVDERTRYLYSNREIDARLFAEMNIRDAIGVYRDACSKIPSRY